MRRRARSDTLRYFRQVEAIIRECRTETPLAVTMADRAADAINQGGKLYFAGDPGLVSEAVGRAGGLMMAQGLNRPNSGPAHSVVVYGWKSAEEFAADRSWLQSLGAHGFTVLGIGPASAPPADRVPFQGVLTSGRGSSPMASGIQDSRCGLPALGNAVNLWDFTGELIAAFTRRHKTPTVWQSIWVAGSKERNAPRIGKPFDPLLKIPAIPAGRLSHEYTGFLLNAVHGLEKSVPTFEGAAEDLQAARASGHHARVFIIAHMVESEIGGPQDPHYLEPLNEPVTDASLQPDDAVLALAYVGIPSDVQQAADAAKDDVTWFAAPTPGMAIPSGPRNRWIDARWKPGDAAVKLPGYDVGALPPSGILQLAAYCAAITSMRDLQPPVTKP